MSNTNDKLHKNRSRRAKIIIVLFLVILLLFLLISLYKNSKYKLLDRAAYEKQTETIATDAAAFNSNEELKNYLKKWADSESASYVEDSYGNLIFEKPASAGKESVDPVVVCVGYNYLLAESHAASLAAAQSLITTDLNAGRHIVIFANADKDTPAGYRGLSSKYFSDNSKVIYLDYGEKSYLSLSSFAMADSDISIPSETVPVECDTAIKIKISGITTDHITSRIGSQPNPISMFGTVLSRLNNKSLTYQIADIKVQSNGNMYPTGIEATILINSYSANSVTKYLDDRIKKFDKSYSKDFPEAKYEYELIQDSAQIPASAYSSDSMKELNTLIYALKNGNYKFKDGEVPEGYEKDEVYATNCFKNLYFSDGKIVLSVFTAGATNDYLSSIIKENTTAANFSMGTAAINSQAKSFTNVISALMKSLQFAYVKTSSLSSSITTLKEGTDKEFTPCSYLAEKNTMIDVVHLRMKDSNKDNITNTLLCYINDQGNFLSL